MGDPRGYLQVKLNPRTHVHVAGISETWKIVHELSGFRQKGFREPVAGKAVSALGAFGQAYGKLIGNEQFVVLI